MVSRVFRDTPIKKQGVFEGKHLALEPVGDKLVKSLSSKEYLLLVQFIDPVALELREVMEIAVDRTDSLRVVAEKICKLNGSISIWDMEGARTGSYSHVDKYLPLNLTYYSMNDKESIASGNPFYLNSDGNVLMYFFFT